MKYFVNVLIFVSAAYARPNVSPAIRFADGKIIGGQEAPKRKDRFLVEKKYSIHENLSLDVQGIRKSKRK